MTWLANKNDNDTIEVLVTLIETQSAPALPVLRHDITRSDPLNVAIVAERAARMAAFQQQRRAAHLAKLATWSIPAQRLQESFTAANTMRLALSVAELRMLLHDMDIVYIEPVTTGERPPQSSPTVSDARTIMNTDFGVAHLSTSGYRDQPWLRIGLMDSGVTPHDLLNGRIAYSRDCVNGTADNCQTGTNLDPTDHQNHGTSTAAVMSGLDVMGNAYKGVAFYSIDSYKVYSDADGFLNKPAVLRGIVASEVAGDEILVAEMQAYATADGGISSAADNAALQYGIVVVAAMGNANDAGPRSPANGYNVMGIGAVDVTSLQVVAPQAAGPTPDGRIKPDFMEPTGVITASDAGGSALRSTVFNGTSGATAFAGGLAALVWNLNMDTFFDQPPPWPGQPGTVYTKLVIEGETPWPSFNNTSGVGLSKLGADWCGQGSESFGETTLSPSVTIVDLPFSVWFDSQL